MLHISHPPLQDLSRTSTRKYAPRSLIPTSVRHMLRHRRLPSMSRRQHTASVFVGPSGVVGVSMLGLLGTGLNLAVREQQGKPAAHE